MNNTILTIDDGPSEHTFMKIVDLKTSDIPAILFFTGENIEKYPDVCLDCLKLGFEIQNHGYSHIDMGQLNFMQITEQIERTELLINQLYRQLDIERPRKLFRPPYGYISPIIMDVLTKHDIKLLMWTYDTRDWDKYVDHKEMLYSFRFNSADNVILMHDHTPHELFIEILNFLQKRGCNFTLNF